MKMRARNFGRAVVLACVLAMPAIQGCATNTDPRVAAAVDDQPFNAWLNNLVDRIKAEPNYKRIPIDTKAEEDQFLVWLHDAYHHRITRQDFAAHVNGRYPNHQNEVAFIVSRLP
ncbi:membrane-bound lytic murein transglycosylase B [Achromobacter deleyi]|uniref:hypothetical protein n=1 Tax=Achromobacter TaxID=222 RepID=UPI000CFBE2F1|nr:MULTISPECIES: hypothetical protein [Achromobacter]MDR6602578.1 membrane-bound lytic murein transglycosylase B [Achromobacter deleyi]PQZ71627.1 hypothetical protein CQ050_00860 [Achromobacter sp. MYb9]